MSVRQAMGIVLDLVKHTCAQGRRDLVAHAVVRNADSTVEGHLEALGGPCRQRERDRL